MDGNYDITAFLIVLILLAPNIIKFVQARVKDNEYNEQVDTYIRAYPADTGCEFD